MKIGILTQPLQWNYGGIIQNWALQQVLGHLGHDPEMIFLDYGKKLDANELIMRSLRLAKSLVKKFLLGREAVYLHSPFDPRYNPNTCYFYADSKFVKRIRKTKALGYDTDLARIADRRGYDAFIVGSDQVWREEYSPNILSYFLDFLPENDRRPRIAYAASFGKGEDYISDDKLPECRRLLTRFDAVSVRENEGIKIVSKDFGLDRVEKVLDPTLLLSASDYENLILPDDRHKEPYIATYILDSKEDKSAIIGKISTVMQLPVNAIDTEVRPDGMPTVSQWLANFADADFVVTDSFHGCVFSIIFGKPFIAIANAGRGLDRFLSLLGDFGLTDRLVYGYEDFAHLKDGLLAKPDYGSVGERLGALRQKSLKFLTDALA